MILVRILGGLGNQMYCYALYRTFLERGQDAWMDIFFYEQQSRDSIIDYRNYELSNVFNINARILNEHKFKYFMMRIKRKINILKTYIDKETGFQPEILDIKSGFLIGYWQSFNYSTEIENILRKEFTFKKIPTGEAAKLLDDVRNCNSVSISFRRGDYLKLGGDLSVLPVEYYTNAIRYIQERVPNAKFFCVSDDIDYCKNLYGSSKIDIKFVAHSANNSDAYDMQLISQCKHNILANSTFSIWGAWLNQNPGKIVLRPEWFPNRKDFWPEDWIMIPSQLKSAKK